MEGQDIKIRVSSGSMYEDAVVDAVHADGFWVFDCRLLPDPYMDAAVRKLDGLDPRMAEWFAGQSDGSKALVRGMVELARAAVRQALAKAAEWGYKDVEFFCGCAGGHHRSPYVAHLIAEAIRREFKGVEVEEYHPRLYQ